MSLLRELWVDNPMRVESKRFRQRFLRPGRSSATNQIAVILIFVLYGFILLLTIRHASDIDPIALIIFQLVLFTLLPPAILHGAIAGEREKRSLDFLLVAPVTRAQIVAGKFIGALEAMGALALAMLLPIGVCTLRQLDKVPLLALFQAELVTLCFGVFACAFSLLCSSRTNRAYIALGVILGTFFILLAVWPIIVGILTRGNGITFNTLILYHPYVTTLSVYDLAQNPKGWSANHNLPHSFYGWPQMVLYLTLTVACLSLATIALYDKGGKGKVRLKIQEQNHA